MRGTRPGAATPSDQSVSRSAHLRGALGRFARGEGGSLVIFSLFMLVAMLLIGGFAVDLIRAEAMRTRLQSTLDRALLAAADLEQRRPATEVVADYFARAGLSAYAPTDVSVQKEVNLRAVCATTSADVDTLFLRMAGVATFPAGGAGCAREHVPNVEISMVLDISGSMRYRVNGERKIDRLRPAAVDFVAEMLEGDRADQTSISVVPYAGAVNSGRYVYERIGGARPSFDTLNRYRTTASSAILDSAKPFENGYHRSHFEWVMVHLLPVWVQERKAELSEETYGDELQALYDGLSDAQKTYVDALYGQELSEEDYAQELKAIYEGFPEDEQYLIDTLHDRSFCAELTASDFDDTGLPNADFYTQLPDFHYYTIDRSWMNWGWCPGPETAITYFSGDVMRLSAAIGTEMQLYDGTGTHYAMRWALALLDPATSDLTEDLVAREEVDAKFEARPAAWEDPEALKVIVLMTDGEITEQRRPADPAAPKNADTELTDSDGGDAFEYSSRTANRNSFDESCQLAKDQGVIVYTIAFNAGGGRDEMRDCATTENHFYDVQGLDIEDAFNSIAGHINRLRLTR